MPIPNCGPPSDPVRLSGQLWGITTYFNPAGYRTKLRNLQLFSRRVRRQGLKLLVIELAFADGEFTVNLDLADSILQIRTGTVLWQKERLLNIGIERLPDTCDKVVWLDGDILFSNDAWVSETGRRLEEYRVVQPYDTAVWLPPGGERQLDSGMPAEITAAFDRLHGVAFAAVHHQSVADLAGSPARAHPGFAWAARRNILSAHGLYDRFIVGGGDLVTTSGMYSDSTVWAGRSISRLFSSHQIVDLSRWTDAFYRDVNGSVGYVSGSVFHLWHGDFADRKYLKRYQTLKDFDFDPRADIELDGSGCWCWSSEKPELHRQVQEYFWNRREDG
ncbi:MAG TPA: hypothetical protein VJ302_23245 [Blastocatellia bacterium]|nr:hypothetical protein [Blastocatellia bacterium]